MYTWKGVYATRPSSLAARKNKKSVASKSILTPANKAAVCGFRHDRKNVQFFFLVFFCIILKQFPVVFVRRSSTSFSTRNLTHVMHDMCLLMYSLAHVKSSWHLHARCPMIARNKYRRRATCARTYWPCIGCLSLVKKKHVFIDCGEKSRWLFAVARNRDCCSQVSLLITSVMFEFDRWRPSVHNFGTFFA